MKSPKLSPEERNAIIWLERQPGVTSVIAKRRQSSRHRHAPGFTKVVSTDAKSVTLRTYLQGAILRDLYVHATASPDREKWIASIGKMAQQSSVSTSTLQHTVPTLSSFSAEVPAPKPLDPEAGQLFDVTPALAAKWLERNTRNRPLRDSVVLRYAADMRDGKWKVTGDAIAFDTTGAVINGQHRLWAVLESGVTVKMLVVFDLDPDVVYVLDDHFKRRLTDIIHIARPGSMLQTKHTAVARAMMFNLTSVDKRGQMSRVSRQAQVEFMDRHMEAIEFAFRDCLHSKNARVVSNAQICAALARAYYTQDRERLKQFGQVMTTGMADGPDDQIAIVFRNWLLGLESRNLRAKSQTIYGKAERAIYGFLKRERVRALFEATEELFPLPEEQTPKSAMPKIHVRGPKSKAS